MNIGFASDLPGAITSSGSEADNRDHGSDKADISDTGSKMASPASKIDIKAKNSHYSSDT